MAKTIKTKWKNNLQSVGKADQEISRDRADLTDID